MCVALPARITWIGSSTDASIPARAEVGGAVIDVDLVLTPEASTGDHVIVHAGFAIGIVGGDAAAETLALLGVVDDR
jgi:hydrogenase expression/formation protein HypC